MLQGFKEKKNAIEAYNELDSKSNEISDIVKKIKSGKYDGDDIRSVYIRLGKLRGTALGLQEQYNEKGYEELAEKAAAIYQHTQTMISIVEGAAEKKNIRLEDDVEG